MTDTSDYYHHELATCHFNPDNNAVHIALKIPIAPILKMLKLIEAVSVPFLHTIKDGTGQFCSIEHAHNLVVVLTEGNTTTIIPIDNAKLPDCNPKKI